MFDPQTVVLQGRGGVGGERGSAPEVLYVIETNMYGKGSTLHVHMKRVEKHLFAQNLTPAIS